MIPHFCRDFGEGIEDRQFKIEDKVLSMRIEEILRMMIRIRIED